MDKYTPEQIQEKYDALPEPLKGLLSSPDVHEKIRKIGDTHGLLIDKVGELVDQVGLVVLGFAKSSNFVSDITTRLEIDSSAAETIAKEINTEVFGLMRDSMRPVQPVQQPPKPPLPVSAEHVMSSTEKAGRFEIVREPASPLNPMFAKHAMPENRWDIMKGIEGAKIETGAKSLEENIEPLVDQLLRGPSATPMERITRRESAPEQPKKPFAPVPPPPVRPPLPPIPPTNRPAPQNPSVQPPQNLPTSDPYREAVN